MREESLLFLLLSSSLSCSCRWHEDDSMWFNCQATVLFDVAPDSDSHRLPHYTDNNRRRWITARCTHSPLPQHTHTHTHTCASTQILIQITKVAKGSHYLHRGISISSQWQQTSLHMLSVYSRLVWDSMQWTNAHLSDTGLSKWKQESFLKKNGNAQYLDAKRFYSCDKE